MIDRSTAEHYVWGQRCDGWHLVSAAGLSVIEEMMPPGTSETRHFHQNSRQFFYVLRGELTLETDERVYTLLPGQGHEVSPGVMHQVRNPATTPAEFLVVSVPPTHGDRVPAPAGTSY
jgi:mannose-6-phosphate isomerase-like protein (cupin superfamily)